MCLNDIYIFSLIIFIMEYSGVIYCNMYNLVMVMLIREIEVFL